MKISRNEANYTLPGRQETGIALILVMLAMLVLTLLTAALVFTSRSETLASTNYRLDTEADYLAKAGIETAINWFRSNHYAAVPEALANTDYYVTSDGSVFNLYTTNSAPVTCKANCTTLNGTVQLVGYGSNSSNFPSGITNGSGTAIATAFATDLNNSGSGMRVTGDANNSGLVWINAYLLNYQTINCSTCSANPAPMETWLITAKGQWTGPSSDTLAIATAEEQAIIQPLYSPSFGDALYGYCSVSMSGSAGTCTDAYNSALGPYGGGNPSVASGHCDSTTAANVISDGANVGANGYVSLSSNVTVSGNAVIGNANPALVPSSCCTSTSSPSCGAHSSGTVLGSIITGAPYVTPPAVPTFPGSGQTGIAFPGTAPGYNGTAILPQTAGGVSPTSPTITPGSPVCVGVTACTQPCVVGATCNGSAANPFLISSISPNGNNIVTLVGGPDIAHPVYYDIDTISFSGQASMAINGWVVLNVKTTLDIEGQGVVNGITQVPEALRINYAGTAAAKLAGNGDISAIVTAANPACGASPPPPACVTLGGGGSSGAFIGAIQAQSISDQGGFPVHYDIQLSRLDGSLGQIVVSSYTRIKQ